MPEGTGEEEPEFERVVEAVAEVVLAQEFAEEALNRSLKRSGGAEACVANGSQRPAGV